MRACVAEGFRYVAADSLLPLAYAGRIVTRVGIGVVCCGDIMTAREIFEDGTRWADVTARVAVPMLLRRAMDGDPITYGELNQLVIARGGNRVTPIAYRFVADKIGGICEELETDLGDPVPPLNAIIVNRLTGLPSDGVDQFLARFLHLQPHHIARLTQVERDAYAKQVMDNVFNYEGWDRVRENLGLQPVDLDHGRQDRGEPIPPPNQRRFATGPESDAHKALKAWVANHPDLFADYGEFQPGRTEQVLSSGDRLDALFDNSRQMLAVEVKAQAAPDAEIERGIYQCIKYRAILRAMQIAAARPPNGNAVLVLERTPPINASHLAQRLSVKIITVGTNR